MVNINRAVPLVLLILIVLSVSSEATISPNVLACQYNAVTRTVSCGWKIYPNYPQSTYIAATDPVYVVDPTATCAILPLVRSFQCVIVGQGNQLDYFGNVITTGVSCSGNIAYNGYFYTAPNFAPTYGALMTRSGNTWSFVNISTLCYTETYCDFATSTIIPDVMVQCKTSSGIYQNQVEVITSGSTSVWTATGYPVKYMYQNGGLSDQGYIGYVGDWLEFTAYNRYVGGYSPGGGARFVNWSTASAPSALKNIVLGTMSEMSSLGDSLYGITLSAATSANYRIQVSTALYESTSIASNYVVLPQLVCGNNRTVNASCSLDCQCAYVSGVAMSCMGGQCKVNIGSPCDNSGQCASPFLCVYPGVCDIPAGGGLITEPSLAVCRQNSNCSVNEECNCGWSARDPITNITGDGSIWYKNSTSSVSQQCLTGTTPTGQCKLADSQSCTTDSQCASGSCYDKGTDGVGTCALYCSNIPTACGVNSGCVTGTLQPSFTAPKNLAGVTMPLKYCFAYVDTICNKNDFCFNGNCKPDCESADYSRCVIPGSSCYCTFSTICPDSKSCVQLPFDGPVGAVGGIFGTSTCISGSENGDVCIADGACSSGNCQNGYCCSANSTCCSSPTQCIVPGQTCFNNIGWAGWAKYYTCADKIIGNGQCSADSDCASPPCVGHLCSGAAIQTSMTYTSQPTNLINVPVGTVVNITMSYTTVPGTVITGALCTMMIEGSLYQDNCNETQSFTPHASGTWTFVLSATKAGYEFGEVPPFTMTTYDPLDLYSNGQLCTSDANCLSGRCQQMYAGTQAPTGSVVSLACGSDADCSGGETCIGAIYSGRACNVLDNEIADAACTALMGSTSDCLNLFNDAPGSPGAAVGVCYSGGTCTSETKYKMCAANDGKKACDLLRFPPLSGIDICPGLPYTCDPTNMTCSVPRKNMGQVCSRVSGNCVVGSYCGSTSSQPYPSDIGICCAGGAGVNACGNNATGHPCAAGFVENIMYQCIAPTGPVGEYCNSNNPNEYDWCLDKYGNEPLFAKCIAGVCGPFSCPISTPLMCIRCSDTNQTTPDGVRSCGEGVKTVIGCYETAEACYGAGGTPGYSSGSTGTQDLDANSMFSSLINLSYYLMILVMIGFGVFIIAAGMHAAIGVVKR
jgi:hypothetical protein